MRAVNSPAAVRCRREKTSQASRNNSAIVDAPRPACATPAARQYIGPREQYVTARNMCAHQRQLLIELLVQSFVVCTRYVPAGAQRLLALSELPPVLERVAIRVQRGWQKWFAWTDERRTWFVVAETAMDRGRPCHHEALRMFFYDEDGQCVTSGAWAFHGDARWTLVNSAR